MARDGVRRAADANIPVAELAKSFGRHGESPKVLATSATAGESLSAVRLTKRATRAGVILVVALVSLLVVTLLGGELIKATVVRHRQARLAEQRQQSFWLAESAVGRALHALAESPDYEGETWRVPESSFGTGLVGVAVISVEPAEGPSEGRLIRVQAHYPDDPVHRILHERELLVN